MRKKLLLLIGAVLVLLAPACATSDGGGEVTADGGTPEAPAPDGGDDTGAELGSLTPAATPAFMKAAAQATSEVESFSMTMTMQAVGVDELPGDPVIMAIDGVFTEDGTVGSMRMDMSGMVDAMGDELTGGGEMDAMALEMFDEPWEIVLDGEDMYLRMPILAMLGVDAEWIRSPIESGGGDFGTGGVGQATSAAEMAQLLEGAGDVTEVGTEEIDGVSTTHYSVELDWDALAASVGEAEAAELGEVAAGALSMDVWIDGDGLLRRMEMEMDMGALGADLGTGSSGSILMVMELRDFDEPVEVQIPDPSEVTDADDLGMGLLGG